MQESTEMIACAAKSANHIYPRRRYTSYQFCAFCRMTRSVYTLCGFQNLNPVGFCVVCAFCGNYKQRRYKYKSFSPINCNLQFYHSKFRMNHVFYVYSRIYFPAHRALLYIQIKLSRACSRKALSECKASRRLGKYIRGFNCYCTRPAATAIV